MITTEKDFKNLESKQFLIQIMENYENKQVVQLLRAIKIGIRVKFFTYATLNTVYIFLNFIFLLLVICSAT